MDKELIHDSGWRSAIRRNHGLINLMFKVLHMSPFPCFLYQYVPLRYGGSIFSLVCMCQVVAFAHLSKGNGGMAKKPTTSRTVESDVSKELENALDFDLARSPGRDLDMSASMDDLEAQISQAADELVREGRNGQPKAAKPAPELRPVDRPVVSSQPAAFAPANDDRQKDFRSLMHGLNQRASRTVYWVAAVLSLVWLGASVLLADQLFGPVIWQTRTVQQVFARPEWAMFGIGVLLPVILFWAFAAMVRRAQEMRLAAQSMTEVAFRLAEPEEPSPGPGYDGWPSRPPRGCGDGRRHRTHARAGRRTRNLGPHRGQPDRAFLFGECRADQASGRRIGQRARGRGHPRGACPRLDHRRA